MGLIRGYSIEGFNWTQKPKIVQLKSSVDYELITATPLSADRT